MSKPSLQSVAKKASGAPVKTNAPAAAKKPERPPVVNPARGERGDFVKLTVTLSPEAYQLIMTEVTRRKTSKEADPNISAILREAVMAYLYE